jgi:hypothetical protein
VNLAEVAEEVVEPLTPGQSLFGTAALPLEVWLYMLPFAAAMFALNWRAFVRKVALGARSTSNKSPNASIAEFITLAEEESGRALQDFFDVWLYERGKPPTFP